MPRQSVSSALRASGIRYHGGEMWAEKRSVGPGYRRTIAAPIDAPVWRAVLAAPIDDTPQTEEERAAIEEVMRTGFRTVSGATMTAEIARRVR